MREIPVTTREPAVAARQTPERRALREPVAGFRTPICDLLGIRLPIFGFSHEIDVVAAICRAGGLGVFGVAREDPERIPLGRVTVCSRHSRRR